VALVVAALPAVNVVASSPYIIKRGSVFMQWRIVATMAKLSMYLNVSRLILRDRSLMCGGCLAVAAIVTGSRKRNDFGVNPVAADQP